MHTKDLAELLGRIYAAVERPAEWPDFLERLRMAMEGTGAALMHHDTNAPQLSVQAFAGFESGAIAQYHAHYSSVDPWGRSLEPADWVPGRVVNGLELVSDAEVRGGEYYNDFGRRYGCVNAAFGLLEPMGSRIGFITINRGDGQPAFARRDMRLLQALTPHLRQAFRLQRRLIDAAGVTTVACGALDALPSGVVLLDADGIVRFMNRVAAELVRRKDGLWIDGRRLRGTRQADTARLAGAVRTASTVFGRVAATSAPLAFTLSRVSGQWPLRVVVVPVGSANQALGADVGASVAVFVTDPDRDAIEAPARLVQLFGFTPTEARVAALLAGGSTVSDIADTMAIRPDTVRGHVKRLLSKASVRTQGQLIGLILRGPAGILFPRQP